MLSKFLIGMADFIQVRLASIVYAASALSFHHILLSSISFLFYLSKILFLSLRICLRWTMIFCAVPLTILISWLIEAYFLYLYNRYRALFNSLQILLCFSISFFECTNGNFYQKTIYLAIYSSHWFHSDFYVYLP